MNSQRATRNTTRYHSCICFVFAAPLSSTPCRRTAESLFGYFCYSRSVSIYRRPPQRYVCRSTHVLQRADPSSVHKTVHDDVRSGEAYTDQTTTQTNKFYEENVVDRDAELRSGCSESRSGMQGIYVLSVYRLHLQQTYKFLSFIAGFGAHII